MNALWLNRIYKYKISKKSLSTSKKIIEVKIHREQHLIKKYKCELKVFSCEEAANLTELTLVEARAAKYFWTVFASLIDLEYKFSGRVQHGLDVPNRLLDIGFHHITSTVSKIYDTQNIPTEVGLMHMAHKTDSKPLVYDTIEMFRADLVVTEVLSYLRLKKKVLHELTQEDIAHFLANINKRMDKKYYLKEFGQCHTYKYYMELQILRIIKAVNHHEVLEPFKLPARHDTRCSSCQAIDK